MDANEFIKEAYRMCNCHNCDECPARGGVCIVSMPSSSSDLERNRYITIVEKWSKEHPITTNSNKIEEVFGKDILHRFENVAHNTKNEALKSIILDFLNGEYKEPTGEEINNGIHEN